MVQCDNGVSDYWSLILWMIADHADNPHNELATLSFWIRALMPVLVTGGIALIALSVARTQRMIAANKYNLDLFDKRLASYEDMNRDFKKLVIVQTDYGRFFKDGPEFQNFVWCIYKCFLIFPRYYDNGLDGEIYLYRKKLHELQDVYIECNKSPLYKDMHLHSGSEIPAVVLDFTSGKQRKMTALSDELVAQFSRMSGYIVGHLGISHSPY